MSELTIVRHDHGSHGIYHAYRDGDHHVGRMTWVARGDARLVDHTLVPPEYGGQGIAARLVEAIIADAREQGFRIVPQCSYVARMFDRHPEWAELRA